MKSPWMPTEEKSKDEVSSCSHQMEFPKSRGVISQPPSQNTGEASQRTESDGDGGLGANLKPSGCFEEPIPTMRAARRHKEQQTLARSSAQRGGYVTASSRTV